jgi:hypothetical protein
MSSIAIDARAGSRIAWGNARLSCESLAVGSIDILMNCKLIARKIVRESWTRILRSPDYPLERGFDLRVFRQKIIPLPGRLRDAICFESTKF